MSFKQAKEIAEKLELSEIILKNTLKNIEKVTSKFDESINNQDKIIKQDSKITNLKILIAINFGFIIGLLVSKYFL